MLSIRSLSFPCGPSRFAAYGATKRSLEQFTKSLQAELKMLSISNVVVHNLSVSTSARCQVPVHAAVVVVVLVLVLSVLVLVLVLC